MKGIHGRKPRLRRALLNFGKLIRAAREKRVSSQKQAVAILAGAGLKVSQSWIAQLELGNVTEPSPEILRQISTAFGVEYDVLLYTLVSDKFRLTDRGFLPEISRLRWKAFESLLRKYESVGEVAGLEERQLIAKGQSLEQELLDEEGLANWIERFPNLSELWIATASFQPQVDSSLRAVLVKHLKRGARIFYFLPRTELADGRAFWRFLARLSSEMRKPRIQIEKQIRVVPLDDAELVGFFVDMIVANPTEESQRVGFVGLAQSDRGSLYYRLASSRLAIAVERLFPLLVQRAPAK